MVNFIVYSFCTQLALVFTFTHFKGEVLRNDMHLSLQIYIFFFN